MARYIVTSGSFFNPFSYDELAKPLEQATEAHNETADAYDQMSMEASALEEYLKKEPEDSRARSMYNTYMNQLTSLQDELWNNGYSANARRGLGAARAGYATNITRLQKAISDRQTRSKEYWDTAHKNPDMVMGFDPGLASLDKYLENDLYGSDYYSYSGKDFMSAVGTDAKARVSELLRNPKYQKDVPGYITRFMTSGATSAEVEDAKVLVDNVLDGKISRDSIEGGDSIPAILASTLLSHLDSTGASYTGDSANLSEQEYRRLVGYGKAGLSQAIGETKSADLEDLIYRNNLEFEDWKRRQNYTAELTAKQAAAKKAAEDASRIPDTHTRELVNPKQGKMERKLTRKLDANKNINVVTSGGKVYSTAADASDTVYSGDVRRRAYEKLGFDVGRNPHDSMLRGSDSFITGTVVKDGTVYETRYNPRVRYRGDKGAVEYRAGNGQWMISPSLTDVYDNARKEYEDNLKYYKKNEKDLYYAATIDPDKQYRIYKRDNSSFSIPLGEYESTMEDTPIYKPGTTTDTYVARGGTDSGGYAQRMADILSSSIYKNGSGNPDVQKGWRGYNGQFEFIHPMTKWGTLESKAMKKPSDVFTFDKGKDNSNKTNRITNVSNVRLDADAIMNGYIIFDTTDSNAPYAVGIGMFNSDQISAIYSEARAAINEIINDPNILPESEGGYEEWAIQQIVNNAVRRLQDSVGYDMNTQSQGGTSQENRN